MLKKILFSVFPILLYTAVLRSQTPITEPWQVIDQDLVGTWEVQLTPTDYFRIRLDSIMPGLVAGDFMRFTKNPDGTINQMYYDSTPYSIPNGGLPQGLGIYFSDPGPINILAPSRRSAGLFRDYGISRGDPYDKKKWDVRDVDVIVFQDCPSCPQKLRFKITSLKTFLSKPETLVPEEMILERVE